MSECVAITAYVFNASTNAPIATLSAINFQGMIGGDCVGEPVTSLGNGKYTLIFDGSQTSRITVNDFGFALNMQVWTNQALLTFAMQPVATTQVAVSVSAAGSTASATVTVTNPPSFAYTLAIVWGDGPGGTPGTPQSVGTNATTGSASHNYTSPGTYLVAGEINRTSPAQVGYFMSPAVRITISSPKPPTPGQVGPAGAVLAAYNQTTQPFSPCLFVGGGTDGHLWQTYWDQAAAQWLWVDHGMPPGTSVVGRPTGLLDSTATGLKFFMLAGNGHIFERYWNQATSAWAWTDHGTPPGVTVSTDPGACISSYTQPGPPLSPAYFVGGADGHLWENYWNQAANSWLWTDHGTPPGTTVTGPPGALMNSVATGLKFVMATANGHIFERYWNTATSAWGWTDHGTPPGTTPATGPGTCLSAYGQSGQPLTPAFFVAGANGHLLENYWDQAANSWLWTDHGTPPGTSLVRAATGGPDGTPGALFNSADVGLKFMMTSLNGHVFERYWNAATSSWGWTDHGTPPGTTASNAPSCPLDSAATGIKFFVSGIDGHLWENYWNQPTQQWLWTDHGTP